MRRQVKPFVTEYRGSARRGKDHPGDHQQDLQAPRSRSFAEAEKVFQSEAPEDSYEAALRAADALFDVSEGNAQPTRGNGAASAHKTHDGPLAFSAFRIQPDEVAKEGVADDVDAATTLWPDEKEVAAAPRRILQAIEPPAEDRFAALEAERAPKRRGRKPGSKNKPKIVVGDDWAAPMPRPLSAKVSASPAAEQILRAPVFARPPVLAAPMSGELVEETMDEPMPQPRGRNDKFGWKRAGLRPGERWKRRLPKAAR